MHCNLFRQEEGLVSGEQLSAQLGVSRVAVWKQVRALRLAGYEIALPALIDRLEDFGRLFMHFASMELRQLGETENLQPRGPDEDPWLPTDLVEKLLSFSWSGNVRQLRNAVRQLLIGCRGEAVLHSVPKLENMLVVSTAKAIDGPDPASEPPVKRKPSGIPREELFDALKHNLWDIKATASQLGISRPALYGLIDQTPGLRKAGDLSAEEIKEGLDRHHDDIEALAEALNVSARALRRRMSQLELQA